MLCSCLRLRSICKFDEEVLQQQVIIFGIVIPAVISVIVPLKESFKISKVWGR